MLVTVQASGGGRPYPGGAAAAAVPVSGHARRPLQDRHHGPGVRGRVRGTSFVARCCRCLSLVSLSLPSLLTALPAKLASPAAARFADARLPSSDPASVSVLLLWLDLTWCHCSHPTRTQDEYGFAMSAVLLDTVYLSASRSLCLPPAGCPAWCCLRCAVVCARVRCRALRSSLTAAPLTLVSCSPRALLLAAVLCCRHLTHSSCSSLCFMCVRSTMSEHFAKLVLENTEGTPFQVGSLLHRSL